MVAVVAEQDRLQEEYNNGAARLEEFATSPPVEMNSNIGRIQHLEIVGRRAPQREGRSAIKRSRVEASRRSWP